MRGKKVDKEFVSEYISSCTEKNILLMTEIISLAKDQIKEIDERLKEVSTLKIRRGQLLDVISYLEAKEDEKDDVSIDKETEYKLRFYSLENPGVCSYIVQCIFGYDGNGETNINEIMDFLELQKTYPCSKEDAIFCFKQLIQKDILTKDGDIIGKGKDFDNYLSFLEKGF
jgi:hypothetical protein